MGMIVQDNRGRETVLTFRVGIGKRNVPLKTIVFEKDNVSALRDAVEEGLAHFRQEPTL